MGELNGTTGNINEAAVKGVHTAEDGRAVYGESKLGYGVWGWSDAKSGVTGDSVNGAGVLGESTNWLGVYGHSKTQHGVWGESDVGAGVVGIAHKWHGVHGKTESTTGGNGVVGEHTGNGAGVVGTSINGVGVWGVSETYEAVHAETKSPTTAAIAAYNLNPNGTGAAIYAKKEGNEGLAGFFEGSVHVTRNVSVKGDVFLEGADFAEDFDVMEQAEPGEVMVLTETGGLELSAKAYDKKVVGVISGAGHYRPGIILDKQNNAVNRKPIAMMGKVFCKVDADTSSIETGDMLTTSDIPGYAMKAIDPFKAFGAVIGKALVSLKEGKGLIPILVVLQ